MKKLLYIPAILILAACGNDKPKDKKAELADLKKQQAELNDKITKFEAEVGTPDSVKSTDVSVFNVKKQAFTNYVQIQGSIDAQENVTAYPQMPAAITAIYVKTGDHVQKGQTLAQLDNSVMKQNIAQAQAQADLSKTLFDRQKNLWDQKIGTEVQYLQAKASMEANERQVASLRQQSDLYRIVSPIDGSIDQMDLKLGNILQPGQGGIRIVNSDLLKIKANVPESYSGRISQGDNVKVVVPDAHDSVMAKVTFAAKVIDAASRSYAIEVRLPARKTLRPNMTAVLKIADYSTNKALVVPVNAIQRSEQGNFVFLNQENTAKKVPVTLGATYGGVTEVKSGLNGGEQLIDQGASEVEDGDKIKVVQSDN